MKLATLSDNVRALLCCLLAVFAVSTCNSVNLWDELQDIFDRINCTHEWQDLPGATQATCVSEGHGSRRCLECSRVENNFRTPPNPDAHDWEWTENAISATCGEPSKDTAVCKNAHCNEKDERAGNMPPLEHSFDAWQINAIGPTETEDNKDARTCTACSSEETRPTTGAVEYATGTTGLTFEFIAGGGNGTDAYRVRRGTVIGIVHIPAFHRPPGSIQYLPVTMFVDFGNQSITEFRITEFHFLAPSNITSIGQNAFLNTELTSITIPNSVTSNSGEAFRGCTRLTSITIPSSVTSIGSSAFNGCTGLTSVVIPNSVTSIGVSAFLGCISLTRITIPNSVTTIADNTFNGCSALMDVVIPNSVTSIGSGAFRGCTRLESIIIPSNVTSIGEQAFRGCTELTSVTIHATTPPILGANAFQSTPQDLRIYVPAGSETAYRNAWGNQLTVPSWGTLGADRIFPIP